MGLCCVAYSLAVPLCDSCATSILYLLLGLELKQGLPDINRLGDVYSSIYMLGKDQEDHYQGLPYLFSPFFSI